MVEEQSPLKKFLFDDVPLLSDVVEFFKQSNGMMKRNILRCIFSEKIYFDEKKMQPSLTPNQLKQYY
jgi:hypothetical protein